MQTILGAGGIIGKELAKALPQYTGQIRLVSRSPEKVNPGDELFSADLLNGQKVREAVRGSEGTVHASVFLATTRRRNV